eukprot:445147_1
MKDEKQNEELLLSQDSSEKTALMIAFDNFHQECVSVILNQIKSNVLNRVILVSNREHQTCIEFEMKNSKTKCCELMLEYVINEKVYQTLFLAAIQYEQYQFVDAILSKIKRLKIPKKTLFDCVDSDGLSPLFHLFQKGNTKYASIILNEVDKADDKAVSNLVNFRTNKGENFMHSCCKSHNIQCSIMLVSMCEYFQPLKNKLLLATDDNGNNPLHVYLKDVGSVKLSQVSEFVEWYIKLIKKQRDRLSLISQINTNDETVFNYSIIQSSQFGSKLFERVINDINCNNQNVIQQWIAIFHTAISCCYNSLLLRKLILSKYKQNKDKIKLLSTNHLSQNAFYSMMHRKECTETDLKLILSFIDKNNNHLLLEPQIGGNLDGDCVLHLIAANKNNWLPSVLSTFENMSKTLAIKNNQNKSIYEKSTGAFVSMRLKDFSENEICQLFMDNITNPSIRSYIEDHVTELMAKLLISKTSSSNNSLLMEIVKVVGNCRFVWNLIIPYIKKLNDKERLKLLQSTNIIGRSVVHIAATNSSSEYLKVILSLYPQQSKFEALTQMDYNGHTPFTVSIQSHASCAYTIWNSVKRLKTKLKLINFSQMFSDKVNGCTRFAHWIKEIMTNTYDKYIDNINILIYLFHIATITNDLELAK